MQCLNPGLFSMGWPFLSRNMRASLQARGARLAVSGNLEASIALAQSALAQISVADANKNAAIDR
jgi:hypothetical protein